MKEEQWRREQVKAGGRDFEKREKILKNPLKRRESNSDNLDCNGVVAPPLR
jgi:hypothetical protein